jgi:hypothetical protein
MTATIENTYTGNNSTTDYSFTFPYLDDSDIKASLDGVATTNFRLLNATTVQFVNNTTANTPTPPGTDVAIRIYRSTAYDSPKATFYPGSAIRSNDLNDNSLQNLYVTQESNDKVDKAWLTGDPTVISTETWYTTDDTKIGSTKAIENRIGAKIDTAIEGDVLAGTDMAKTATGGQVTINHSVSGANTTINNSDGNVIQDITVSAQGHVTAVGSKNLNDVYFTETELTSGALDGRYYTETETDAAFYKIGSASEIRSDETWSASDTKVATTSAIDARITDMIDDVGGFVPIANETSFPNANPDINNGAGTLVSIKSLSSDLTSNGSGVATIANGTVGNSTVTITGLANSTTYASTYGMIVETTSTLNTYTFHRQVPKATEVTTVAGSISNVNTVATNIAAINTTNSNINAITTVNSNSSNINAVAGELLFSEDLGLITASLTTGSGNDINTVANAITNINTVAGINANITTVAGISANVTTVAGVSSNVTTVAGSIADVNRYANEYKIASSAPGSPSEGDLWYDSTNNVLKYHNGSGFIGISTGLTSILADTSPALGGHLDCNDKNLTEVGTVSGDNLQLDFGTLS